MWEACLYVACLVDLTVDHGSLSRQSKRAGGGKGWLPPSHRQTPRRRTPVHWVPEPRFYPAPGMCGTFQFFFTDILVGAAVSSAEVASKRATPSVGSRDIRHL